MLDIPNSIALKCLFCGLELKSDDIKREYKENDMLKCTYCNELNHYGSIYKVAENEAKDIVTQEIQNELNNLFKKR